MREKDQQALRRSQIAVNQLRSLGAQVYPGKEGLAGRFQVDPEPFMAAVEGTEIQAEHRFEVRGPETLVFSAPSPFSRVGTFAFFEARNKEHFLQMLSSAWEKFAAITLERIERARGYLNEAYIDPQSFEIEVAFSDPGGTAVFRFDEDIEHVDILKIDGMATADLRRIKLPEDTLFFDVNTLSFAANEERLKKRLERQELAAQHALLADENPKEMMDQSIGEFVVATRHQAAKASISPRTEGVSVSVELPVESVRELEDASTSADEQIWQTIDDRPPSNEPKTDTGPAAAPVWSETDEAPTEAREPPLPLRISARMTWDDQSTDVTISSVGRRDAFVSIDLLKAPPLGQVVRLSGFGTFSITAKIAHQRDKTAAAAWSTEQGVIVQFSETSHLGEAQDAPGALVLMKDSNARNRAIEALVGAGCLPMVAENLAAATASLLVAEVSLVVMDSTPHGNDWAKIGRSLEIDDLSTPVIIVGSTSSGAAPKWAKLVSGGRVGKLIDKTLSLSREAGTI